MGFFSTKFHVIKHFTTFVVHASLGDKRPINYEFMDRFLAISSYSRILFYFTNIRTELPFIHIQMHKYKMCNLSIQYMHQMHKQMPHYFWFYFGIF